MVVDLLLPGLDLFRKGLLSVTRSLLEPFLSIVPFSLFLLLDIYWKYLHHEKSVMKSQHNALLIGSAVVFYWLLYSVTGLVVKVEQMKARLDRLKKE